MNKIRLAVILILIGLVITLIILYNHKSSLNECRYLVITKDSSNDYINYYCSKCGCEGVERTGISIQVADKVKGDCNSSQS